MHSLTASQQPPESSNIDLALFLPQTLYTFMTIKMPINAALTCSEILVIYDAAPSMAGETSNEKIATPTAVDGARTACLEANPPVAGNGTKDSAKDGILYRLYHGTARRMHLDRSQSRKEKTPTVPSAPIIPKPARSKEVSKGTFRKDTDNVDADKKAEDVAEKDSKKEALDSKVSLLDQSKKAIKPPEKQKDQTGSIRTTRLSLQPDKKEGKTQASLLTLLFELREQICRELLIAHDHINRPHELVQERKNALIISKKRNRGAGMGIDATILRTCRTMYHEGLQILYGENLFTFDQTAAMELFRDDGLLQVPSPKNQYSKIASFEFLPNAQGRFALIRNLLLKLAGGMSAMPSWTGFLQAEYNRIELPALETLALDFSSWHLDTDEGIATRLFVERFKTAKGLRRLEITGVRHEGSLKQLQEGLVRQGGTFIASRR